MWQLIVCPGSTSSSGGSSCTQISPTIRGHRVWKTQPDGGSARSGSRPRGGCAPAPRPRGWAPRKEAPPCTGGVARRKRSRRHLPPQAAEVHDRDAVGDVADDAEVVRDEEVARNALSLCSSTRRFRIAACTETSRAEVGSSHTTTRGSPAKARAIATLCLRPPESWAGLAPSRRPSKRTDWASSLTRSSRCSPRKPRSFVSARPKFGSPRSGGSEPSRDSGTRSGRRGPPRGRAPRASAPGARRPARRLCGYREP